MSRKQPVSDERWVVALEALDHNNPRELIRVLVIGGVAPIWVRAQLKFWLNGLPLSDDDKRLLDAADDYYAAKARRKTIRHDAEERLAAKHEVSVTALHNFINRQGRQWKRLGKYWLRRRFAHHRYSR